MEQKPIYVTRPEMPPLEEYVEKLKEIWESGWLTNMGNMHCCLEKELKKFLGIEKLFLFTNGHIALETAIEALELTGEVITTPFTFSSTTHAIVRKGLTPVFCDINSSDYTIDTNKIEDLITEKTSAILPVHVYGNICNVEEIDKIAKKYNLKVIYDAAHAFGVSKGKKSILEYGDASMVSFHATKVFNTVEGGAVIYKEPDIGKKLLALKNFGIRSEEKVDYIGGNAKMDEFRAAMGLCNLKYMETFIRKRKQIYERYVERLEPLSGIIVHPLLAEAQSNYSYFPILVQEEEAGVDRDEIYEALRKEQIFARKYFYPLTSGLNCYQNRFHPEETPIAYETAKKVLTLPLYSNLSLEQADRICQIISQLIGRKEML